MRGLNQKIFWALSQAMTKAPNPFPSSNLSHGISDIIQMQWTITWLHTSSFYSPSQVLSLRNAMLNTLPAQALSKNSAAVTTSFRSSSRGFASKALAPNGSSSGSERGGWGRYLLLVPPVIAACLGKWQLDRRQWKIDLLERRQRIMKVRYSRYNA